MFLSKVFANLIFQSLVTYGFAKATIEDPKMSKAVAENALTYMVAWFVALLMFAFTKNIITRFMLFTALSAVAGMFLGTRGKRRRKGGFARCSHYFHHHVCIGCHHAHARV